MQRALAIGAMFGFAAVAAAGEGPVFDVTLDQSVTVYTATPASSTDPGFKPHINFPWLTQRADGSLLTWWSAWGQRATTAAKRGPRLAAPTRFHRS